MHEGGIQPVQPVLRCGLCNKPFDKQSTLKRHGYYCRSRGDGTPSRSRACRSCARQKVRCDNRRPACSRCMARSTECDYRANTPKGAGSGPRIQHGDDSPTSQQTAAPLLAVDSPSVEHGVAEDDGSLLDTAPAIADPGLMNLGDAYLDWGDPATGFTDWMSALERDKTIQYPLAVSPTLVGLSTPLVEQATKMQQAISSLPVSIPTQPTFTIRSLIQRPKMATGSQRTANLIHHTLKSYPQMMMRQNTLPPFIHPRVISSNVDRDNMEPLNNCISLLSMLSSRVPGSRKLFWRNVRMECERLCAEHLQLNKWELLAAMQALSIYIIVRLDEGETDYNDFDPLLIGTVTTIAKQLASADATGSLDIDMSWQDWIFEESRRRLCVVYRVLDMLVYFEPAAMCHLHHTGLLIAPLPARKQLWEAGNAFMWKAENDMESGAFALAANGELLRLSQDQPHDCHAVQGLESLDDKASSRTATWDEWCSGMDEFGGLVMLAASLAE